MGQFRKGESISTQGDDGSIHLVTTWVEFVDEAEGRVGSPRWEPSGFECLRLEDGRAVHALPDGRYDVASSSVVLRRIPSEVAPGTPTGSGAGEAFTSEGGHVAGLKPSASEPLGDAAKSARLMSAFGVTRSGRFFLFHGYRYSTLADAVAYAHLLGTRPTLSAEDNHAALARFEEEPAVVGSAEDERLMATCGISLADGQYVFAAFRYDRLADAVAYARSEQSSLVA